MEIFYTRDIDGNICRLGSEEAVHCIKVLRHKAGDRIYVIDGAGTMYTCSIISGTPKEVISEITGRQESWGSHPYGLHLAVAPTKNADRYEWFVEKACEIGTDIISPVIGSHSERRIFKTARLEKIAVSAAKQSLKGAVPTISEPVSVKDFILKHGSNGDDGILRMIAYCFEDESCPRISIKKALQEYEGNEIIVMIGPEGDFSKEEAVLAMENGFIPVHLGASRLRTETAAVTAAEAVYFKYMQ